MYHDMLGLKYVPVLDVASWSQEIQERFMFNKIEGTKVPHEGSCN